MLRQAALTRILLTSNPILLELSESAPIMEKLSKSYCKNNVSEIPCERYHSSWQHRRILEDVPTPEWQHNFYRKEIYKAFKNKGKVNVLICGLADYAMVTHVLDGCKIAKTKPKITIMDSCQTPLEICKWYLEKNASTTEIDFKLENILDFDFLEKKFDLITTDAYLTQFNKNEQHKIVNKWKRWLKSEGMVLTTAKIEKRSSKTQIKPTISRNYSFIDREFNKAIERTKFVLSSISERLSSKKSRHAENVRFHPFTSLKEIETVFKDFKLEIDVVETKPARLYAQIKAQKT